MAPEVSWTFVVLYFQQLYLNTSTMIAFQINTNFSGRPDLALTYYPSVMEFYWFVARTYAQLTRRHRAGGLPHPVTIPTIKLMHIAFDKFVPFIPFLNELFLILFGVLEFFRQWTRWWRIWSRLYVIQWQRPSSRKRFTTHQTWCIMTTSWAMEIVIKMENRWYVTTISSIL